MVGNLRLPYQLSESEGSLNQPDVHPDLGRLERRVFPHEPREGIGCYLKLGHAILADECAT